MPPVHSGMVPSAFPAFSPPSGVRSAPSRAASWELTADQAGAQARSPAIAADRANPMTFFDMFLLHTRRTSFRTSIDARRNEVTIVQQVVLTRATEVRVVHGELGLRLQIGRHSEGR